MRETQNCHRGLRRRVLLVFYRFLFLLAGLGLLSGCGGSDLNFPTEYQAVFLDNGQVFFGRLEDSGSAYLTLRDVFYVQRLVEADKKDAKNILVKRGSEWHGPEFMRLNSRHVVLIEPVAPDSRVAQLIREAKVAPARPAVAPAPAPAPPPAAAPAPAPAAPPAAPPANGKKRAPARR
jgi:hypothetical protein